MARRMWDENELIKIAEEHGGGGQPGPQGPQGRSISNVQRRVNEDGEYVADWYVKGPTDEHNIYIGTTLLPKGEKGDPGEVPEDVATKEYVGNYVAQELVNKQDKLESYSDRASVDGNTLTVNYKVRQEDGTYSDVPVSFTAEGGSGALIDVEITRLGTTNITQELADAIAAEPYKYVLWTMLSGSRYECYTYTGVNKQSSAYNTKILWRNYNSSAVLTSGTYKKGVYYLEIDRNTGLVIPQIKSGGGTEGEALIHALNAIPDTLPSHQNDYAVTAGAVKDYVDAHSGGSSYTFANGLTESDGTVSWDLSANISKVNDRINHIDKIVITNTADLSSNKASIGVRRAQDGGGLVLSPDDSTMATNGLLIKTSEVRPTKANVNLGSSGVKWNNVYLSGTITIGNTELTEAQLQALLALLG